MKIKLLNPLGLPEEEFEKFKPQRAHDTDAGADVFCPFDVEIHPQETIALPVNIGIEVPNGHAGFIYPKSSLSKLGLVSQLAPVDCGYTGCIHAIVTNLSDKSQIIKKYQKIGQLVIMPVSICDFVSEYKGIERGDGAFGSTGK